MKKTFCIILSLIFISNSVVFAENETQTNIEIEAPSAILLDLSGNIIYEKNSHTLKEPASVTKVMTMLLAIEYIANGDISLDDIVIVSKEAESQGGTQVYLEENEQISVNDLLKSIATSSANDGAVALGEHIAGNHASFVELMNKRALEIGMNDTVFKNATGLPVDGHITSAYDIALMSIELLKYPMIYDYTTIWIDSIRDGEFELVNTNKLLNSYEGLNGLKTGYTSSAMYCISATASRDGESFLAVILGAESSTSRNLDASILLDYAFENYRTYSLNLAILPQNINILNGKNSQIEIGILEDSCDILINKNAEVVENITIFEDIYAPIEQGDKIGELVILIDNSKEIILDIVARETVLEIDFLAVLKKLCKCFFMN